MLHGHVSEALKAELYAQAWVNLTASSAEGWCLTVMEAATCGTPSVALRVGGLPESIVDGETGLLADDEAGLVAAVSRLVDEPGLRERLGAAARERAATFTWERTARETLDVLEGARSREAVTLRDRAVAVGDAEGRRHGRGHDGQQRAGRDLHRRCSRACSARRTTGRWRRWSRRS